MGSFRGSFFAVILALVSVQAIDKSQVPLPYISSGYETAHDSEQSLQSHDNTVHSSPGTYHQHYGSSPEGYQFQSGLEGYLIPAMATAYGLSHMHEGAPSMGMVSKVMAHIHPLMSHIGGALPKVAIVIVAVIALLAVGTLLTSSLCAFTPVCHMSFMGVNLTRESVRGLITQDRIAELASFVQNSIKKYQELNSRKSVEHVEVDTNEVK